MQVSSCYLSTNCSANLMWAESSCCTQVRPQVSPVATSSTADSSRNPLAHPPQCLQQVSFRRYWQFSNSLCVDGIWSQSKNVECHSSTLCIILLNEIEWNCCILNWTKLNEIEWNWMKLLYFVSMCYYMVRCGSILSLNRYPFSNHIDGHRASIHFDTLRPVSTHFRLGFRIINM